MTLIIGRLVEGGRFVKAQLYSGHENALTTRVCSFVGVQAENGTYLCGGHMGFSQRVKAAGTTIIYTNKKRNFRDTLTIAGPTTALLKVMVSM